MLDDLVSRALAANLDLRQTAERIVQARQQEIIAGARRLPQVQADISAARNRISENAIPLPPGSGSGQGGAGGGGGVFGLPGSEFNSFRLGADASWELDLFGGAAAGVKAARARTQAAEWSRRDLQVALASEVAAHYVALRSLQRREALAREELSRQREVQAIAASRADAGFTSRVEAGQAQAQVSAAEAKVYPLHALARAEVHALGVLVGQTPESLAAALDAPGPIPAMAAPPPGLPSDLLRRRPDIRGAERQVAAAAADVGVATADLYPRITLSAQPAMVSTELSSLLDWGSRSYGISAGLLWPIFNGGRTRAALAGANSRQTEALLAYRRTVLTALKDVEDALARYQADEAARASLAASLDQARTAEALAQDQYRAGVASEAGALTARQQTLAFSDQLAQARRRAARTSSPSTAPWAAAGTDRTLRRPAMTPRVRIVLIVLAVAAAAVLAWRAWSPRAADADVLSGYVEGDDLYLSSPVAGPLGAIYVTKGQRVAAGAPLFAMDPATLSAQEGQAQGRFDQARAQIDASQAQAAQALANVAAAQRCRPTPAANTSASSACSAPTPPRWRASRSTRPARTPRALRPSSRPPRRRRRRPSSRRRAPRPPPPRPRRGCARRGCGSASSPSAPRRPGGSRTCSTRRGNGPGPTSRSSPCCPTTRSSCASSWPRGRSRPIARAAWCGSPATAAEAASPPGSASWRRARSSPRR